MSLGIKRGECLGYLGINGAGKTSTLKMLTGEVLPSSGHAYMNGLDILKHQTEVRRLIGYCPQHDALLDRLTVREHLELFGPSQPEVLLKVDTNLRRLSQKQKPPTAIRHPTLCATLRARTARWKYGLRWQCGLAVWRAVWDDRSLWGGSAFFCSRRPHQGHPGDQARRHGAFSSHPLSSLY